MTVPPPNIRIYHITNVENLRSIASDETLCSDADMIARGNPQSSIGMSDIKTRRLTLPVRCHPGTYVGDYVPFNFCSRSVMLYVISMANHPKLTYRSGQGPIIHLEADLDAAMAWAAEDERLWALTKTNAGAVYTEFWSGLEDLNQINWDAVRADDFRASATQEAKQAEFLMHHSFPWKLVRRIGVRSADIQKIAEDAISQSPHRPPVEIQPSWYF